MDDFAYRNGELYCESAAVQPLADRFGTPLYLYSAATMLGHYDRLAAAFGPLDPLICYSIKSCPNVHLCRLLAQRGAGFDVVSGGELQRAMTAGGDAKKVVFAGVGKTDGEILAGIDAGIGWFNVESEAELSRLGELAASQGTSIRAALRINPDVDPHTHAYTTTGTKETKFGVDLERARLIFRNVPPAIALSGLHLHLGSPINTVQPYVEAIRKALAFIDELGAAGRRIEMLDIGGGFGANYRGEESPFAADYAEAIVPLLRGRGLKVVIEPGRSIAANAGILLTRVLYVKPSGDKRFVICDAGMNDLVRPALYQAYHFIWPVRPPEGMVPATRGEAVSFPGMSEADVVGPVCETGDFLARGRRLPRVERGDVLAVFTAGAYGMAMASNYNSRPRAAEVLVEGAVARVIRRRETLNDLMAAEMEAEG